MSIATEYQFSLYWARFDISLSGTYSALASLTQRGGLVATYFRTVDFRSPIETVDAHSHDDENLYFTQIDSQVNLWTSNDHWITLADSTKLPTQYFSVLWQGYLLAPHSELFTFSVRAFQSTQFAVILNDETVVANHFDQNLDNEQLSGSYYHSQQILLNKDELYSVRVEFAQKQRGPSKF